MVALIVLLIVIALASGVMRRGGIAGWLALGAAFMVAFGGGQPTGGDWAAAALVGIAVGVRVAQSYLREQTSGPVRARLAGRPVDRAPGGPPPYRSRYDYDAARTVTLDEEIERLDEQSRELEDELGIAPPAWARRPDCHGQRARN